MDNMEITDVSYHRNGVSGMGFHAVLFNDGRLNMMAAVFEDKGCLAVFDRDLAGAGVVAFGYNSFRGDNFEPELRAAITRHQDSWNSDKATWEWPPTRS